MSPEPSGAGMEPMSPEDQVLWGRLSVALAPTPATLPLGPPPAADLAALAAAVGARSWGAVPLTARLGHRLRVALVALVLLVALGIVLLLAWSVGGPDRRSGLAPGASAAATAAPADASSAPPSEQTAAGAEAPPTLKAPAAADPTTGTSRHAGATPGSGAASSRSAPGLQPSLGPPATGSGASPLVPPGRGRPGPPPTVPRRPTTATTPTTPTTATTPTTRTTPTTVAAKGPVATVPESPTLWPLPLVAGLAGAGALGWRRRQSRAGGWGQAGGDRPPRR